MSADNNIINIKTGGFTVPDIIKVNPNTTIEEFKKNIQNEKVKEHTERYAYIALVPIILISEKFNIAFNFKKGIMDYIELTVFDEKDTGSWDDWSLEREIDKLERQKKWLQLVMGKVGKTRYFPGRYKQYEQVEYIYEWGKVLSFYHDIDAYSRIYIKYRK